MGIGIGIDYDDMPFLLKEPKFCLCHTCHHQYPMDCEANECKCCCKHLSTSSKVIPPPDNPKGGFAAISKCCGSATWHRPEDCPKKKQKKYDDGW